PCVTAHDILNELKEEMSGKVAFREIYAEDDFDTFRKYGVQTTPTIVILDGAGNSVGIASGVPDKDALKSELEKLL
ncbi:MAG: thioredoxin family protein, partial [Actinobacteria bacterium]|nr:thioredoxin family protein [Actinomycetota bacterium]